MEDICNDDDITRISKYLNDEALSFKHRATVQMYGKNNPPGKLISVGHASCKDKRTHHAVR